MSIEVIRPGLMTTIQDLGRHRYQKYGVIVSGAMDTVALRLANLLVGNAENEAGLEMTLIGPELIFHDEHVIAICGGDLEPTINDRPAPQNRPVWVKKGTRLRFGNARDGCRSYLAIRGGFDIQPVLGSRSTYLRARLGGMNGRSLKKGDRLFVKPSLKKWNRIEDYESKSFRTVHWSVALNKVIGGDQRRTLRFIRSEQFDDFTEDSQQLFTNSYFKVNVNSDRMGYRLSGEDRLRLKRPLEMFSAPVCDGTIQIPPNGEPILLLADRQTTGGYPKIGYVITVDLPRAAQLKPGEKIQFREASLEEAQRLLIKREKAIQKIKLALDDWWK